MSFAFADVVIILNASCVVKWVEKGSSVSALIGAMALNWLTGHSHACTNAAFSALLP